MTHEEKCQMAVGIINQHTGLNIEFDTQPVLNSPEEGMRYRFTVSPSWSVTEAALNQSMPHWVSLSDNMTEAACNWLADSCERTASELKHCAKLVKK